MKKYPALLVIALLAACQHKPPIKPIITTDTVREAEPVVPSEDMTPQGVDVQTQSLADAPPCLPVDPNTKISPKPRRPVVRVPTPAAPEPVAPPPVSPVPEATVKAVENLSGTVLGKKVLNLEGEDMGRVVDVLADSSGRVRIAIIEFGGFLGVGLKRVAVDWSLLKFRPASPETPMLLDVSRSKLQSAPEYKDSGHPLALMAPPTAAAMPSPSAPPGANAKQ